MSDILAQFREDELPLSTVDVDRAVRAGRRRRRTVAVAAAAAVVAVGAAGFALRPGPERPVVPTAPACGTAAPAPASERFDPLVAEIDASGVPGYRVTISANTTYWQNVGLVNAANDRAVEVTLYARGGEPHSIADETQPIDPATGDPAEPVRGAPAYWLPGRDGAGKVALAWQWTPGAWAIVNAAGIEQGLPTAELRAIATQVAPRLEFGAGTSVTAPFALPLPDGMSPALTLTQHGPRGPVAFHLGLDPVEAPPPTHAAGYVPALWVNANAEATVDQRPPSATEYDAGLGHATYRWDQREEGRNSGVLLVYDVAGYGVEIEPRNAAGTGDARLRQAADLFRTLAFYPNAATDPAAWGDPVTC